MQPTPKAFARRGGQAEQARWLACRKAEGRIMKDEMKTKLALGNGWAS